MYKLKHVPTGLYYQPHKHGGSNLSKRGKVYQTATHGLSTAYKNDSKTFIIYVDKDSVVHRLSKDKLDYVDKDSVVHRLSKDKLDYVEDRYSYNQMKADTNISDWVIEEI